MSFGTSRLSESSPFNPVMACKWSRDRPQANRIQSDRQHDHGAHVVNRRTPLFQKHRGEYSPRLEQNQFAVGFQIRERLKRLKEL